MKNSWILAALSCFLLVGCGGQSSTESTGPAPTQATTPTDKPAQAEGRYQSGDAIYCYAKSGLVLRDKPDQSGAKMASVPFLAKVTIVDDAPFQSAFSVKEACGMEIKGFWVKASFEGKEGYLFDGYLLDHRPYGDETTVMDYWGSFSKEVSSIDKAPDDGVEYYEYYKKSWENGVSFESSGYVGGSNSVLTLPKGMFSFQEAYLLMTSQYIESPENPIKCTCDIAKQNVECNSKDELEYISLSTDDEGNFLIKDSYAD